jgi:Ca-activated chloride channel family protein
MKARFLFLFIAVLMVTLPAYACRIIPSPPDVILPEPPQILPAIQPIQVKSHRFDVTIKNGVAVTTLESLFYNPNNRILEGTYLFPLPKEASISKFSMWIDGKEMAGELLDATKARDLYVSIVQRMIDPGLLEFVGRQTFKMRIFPIPALGDKRVKLTYTQMLAPDGNLTQYVYPLTTVGNGRDDTLGELVFEVKISSDIPIQSVFSPTHKVEVIKREKEATVSFEGRSVQPNKDFILYISHSNRTVDLSLVPYKKSEEDGYFLLMLSPRVDTQTQNPKDVIFVFDTSGSMAGEMIEQARGALKYCINSMREGDRFNIIPFSTEARPYKDGLIEVNKKNIQSALEFIEQEIYARGGTNIEEALSYAINMAPATGDRPFMVVFLTDGKPTIGVREPEEIIKRVKNKQLKQLRLFTFGVGVDLNSHLLDRLAEENHGVREYVSSGEDIEIKVSSFFNKIASPVLSNIKIQFPSADGLRITEVYPREFSDLFSGLQVNMLGRYTGSGDQLIRLTGIMDGKEQTFDFEAGFPKENPGNDEVARLWAVRKIGFLLDQIRLYGEDQELKQEVIRLAKKFGIVTPYTSYLVLEDNATTGALRNQPVDPGAGAFAPEQQNGEMDDARAGMENEAGENSIEASKAIGRMKDADLEEEIAPKTSEKTKKSIRKVAEKTFYLKDGMWYDSEYKDGAVMTRIKYMSDEYLKLMQDHPEICKFLSVGVQVVIVFKGQTYEIYNK